jgi:hypothetical protein
MNFLKHARSAIGTTLALMIAGLCIASLCFAGHATAQAVADDGSLGGEFRWQTGPPLVLPREIAGISCYSIKDPSIVRHNDRWHLFCTIRGKANRTAKSRGGWDC